MEPTVIVSGARTAIGRLPGGHASQTAAALGAAAIRGAIQRAGIGSALVDQVVMGQVVQADQAIRAGSAAVVVAGGMESMANAPQCLPSVRQGRKLGNLAMLDTLLHDALTDQFTADSMGALAERLNSGPLAVSRD